MKIEIAEPESVLKDAYRLTLQKGGRQLLTMTFFDVSFKNKKQWKNVTDEIYKQVKDWKSGKVYLT